jgi:hypothetical protein
MRIDTTPPRLRGSTLRKLGQSAAVMVAISSDRASHPVSAKKTQDDNLATIPQFAGQSSTFN